MFEVIFLLLTVTSSPAKSEFESSFYLNPSHPPPEMGMVETATNLASLYELTDFALGKAIEPLSLEGAFWKFSALFLWDISNVNYLVTVVHELGHGQRLKESGQGAAYEIPYNYLPLVPFLGSKNAHTYIVYNMADSGSEVYSRRFIVGGLEAENVFAKVIRKRLYGVTSITNLIFLESIFSENSTPFYILKTTIGDGYDVSNWLDEMVRLETGDSLASYNDMNSLYKSIRREALIFTLLNPPFWQSIFLTLTLPFSNSSQITVPMLRLGNLEFMPALSYGLTSLGTERYFELYWRNGLTSGKWYLGYLWRIAESDAVCAGFNLSDIPFGKHRFGFNLYGWTGKNWGGGIEPEIGKVAQNSFFSFSVGVKSNGYLQGLPYNSAVWVRLGLKVRLPA